MNVVFISSATSDSAGGDARVARELSKSISVNNKVLLVLSGEKTCHTVMNDKFSKFEISGKRKGDVILPTMNPAKLTALSKTLKKFNPDIIHFHDQGPASFVVLIWALKNKVPTVFTSHTLPSEVISFGLVELFPKAHPLFDNRFFNTYLDLFLKRSSAIVAINDSVLEDLADYDLETPIYKIPNGRNLSHYNSVSYADINETPKKLLFVGYLTKRKNQGFLLDVMDCLPRDSFVLDLVGVSLGDKYGDLLKEKAADLNLPVNFLGKISHEKIPAILEKTHFFTSASLMEVQSLVILEALASGTPVISLNNETTSEFIDDSVGYNFETNVSPENFANKVKELANLPLEKYKRMCTSSRKKVSHLDWSNIANQTLAMYEEVIRHKSSYKSLNGVRRFLKGIDITLFE